MQCIAVFSGRPTYCASCSHSIKWTDNMRQDWEAHASMVCQKCGFRYQLAPPGAIQELAHRVGGDL